MMVAIIVGIVLGLFASGTSVFVATLFDSHLKDIQTIEKLSAVEVVTILPIVGKGELYTNSNSTMNFLSKGN
jgi:capsular polysaccharide biosynthesis protein